jgi:transposase
MLKCKRCDESDYVKYGRMKGHQRYKCTHCGCQFTDTKPRGVDPILKKLAVLLYAHCGVSMLGIAKLFNVSAVAVLKWIRKYGDHIKESGENHTAEHVQVDEMWHFVNGKKTKFGSGGPLMGYHVNLLDTSWVIARTVLLKS